MQRISSVCRSGIQACNPVSGLAFLFFMAANDAMHRIGCTFAFVSLSTTCESFQHRHLRQPISRDCGDSRRNLAFGKGHHQTF